MKYMLVVLLVISLDTICIGDDLEQSHRLSFGSISHTLPSEIFNNPHTTATVIQSGITEECRFEEGDRHSAVLVVTKIRKDYPKDDSLLDKVLPRYESIQQHFGKDVVLLRSTMNQKQRVEELIFLNAAYEKTYPYGLGGQDLSGPVRHLGISLFFVQDGLFFECALHLKRAEGESKNDFIERSQKLCHQWQRSVRVLKTSE